GFSLQTLDDNLFEGPENYTVQLLTPSAGQIVAPGFVTTVIADNDPADVRWSITGDAAVTEGNAADYTVGYTGPTLVEGQTTSIELNLQFLSASSADIGDGDLISLIASQLPAGVNLSQPDPGDPNRIRLEFTTGGPTSVTFSIDALDDGVFEAPEDYRLFLASPEDGQIVVGQNTVTTTITDASAPPNLTVNDVSVAEEAGVAVFTITRSGDLTAAASVDYATANGTATAGSDFTGTTGTANFAAGQATALVTVAITNDTVYEGNETFNLNLSNAVNATILDPQGVGTIIDDLDRPSFSINDISVNETAGVAVFTITKTGSTLVSSTVDFTTASGTATAGSDFTATTGTVNFAAGQATATVTVAITDDAVFEGPETFNVNLSNAVNATISDPQGVGTINDLEDRPGVTVNDVSVAEDAGTMIFTLTRNGSTAQPGTVDFSTADGSAFAGSDYTATSGTASWAAGQSEAYVTVAILEDGILEATETFNLNLTNPVDVTITDNQGIGEIIDAGSPSVFSLAPLPPDNFNGPATERDPGDTPQQIVAWQIFRSGDLSAGHALTYNIVGVTATEGVDYTGTTTDTIIWGAGETSRIVGVLVTGDYDVEDIEILRLDLTPQVSGDTTNITPGAEFNAIVDDDSE
ncbi:MAG: hypothetical protein KC464_05820, partial [Myxococcales bacterium]|nr:hypothetical protein [Myxococcales bacterium]